MIKLLDNETVQKIAAGEVIERPSSIVKELVENSIDAGAGNILVEIKNGGIDSIIVSDDGYGIPEDQIELAFKRHATSKINSFNDLYNTTSMGFRGEALASVVAAADVEIKTRTEEDQLGTKVVFKDSNIVSKNKIAMNRGTIISVLNLFESIPVRRKFLKSPVAEANSINDLMSKLALGNRNISIKYIRDSKIIFHTIPSGNHLSSISDVLGGNFTESFVEINGCTDNYTYTGFVTDNRYYRGNRALQYIYVNGRYIEESEISRTIEKQYRHLIPNGKFPAFQLFIETNPNNIDVNVHPNKQIIKFRQIDELLSQLELSVKEALIPKQLKQVTGFQKNTVQKTELFNDYSKVDKYKDLLEKYNKKDKFYIEENNFDNDIQPDDDLDEIQVEEVILDLDSNQETLKEEYKSEITIEQIDIISNIESETTDMPINEYLKNLNYKGTIFDTYLLFENYNTKSLIIMDQHAAHERVMYEKLLHEINQNSVDRQPLLTPIMLNITSSDYDLFSEFASEFEKTGFSIDAMGTGTILIREVPILGVDVDYKRLFTDIIDALRSEKTASSQYILEIIIKKSCKAAIKSGDKISKEEVEKLIELLSKCDNPLSCPHGRPTYIVYSQNLLEKEFSRIK